MRIRGLLIIAMFAWVGPVAAHGPSTGHKGDCPVARAKAQAATARQKGAWTAPRTIAPPVDVTGEGSIFGIGRSSVLMP